MKYFPKTFTLIQETSLGISQKSPQVQLTKEQVRAILLSASTERGVALQKFTPFLERMSSRYTIRVQILTGEILEAISMKTLVCQEKEFTDGLSSMGKRFMAVHSLLLMSPVMSGENSQLSVEFDLFLEDYESQVFGRLGNYLNEENELRLQLARFSETSKKYVPIDLDPWLSPLLPDATGISQK